MSAVDDIEARIDRLNDSHATKVTQLHELQKELRYNSNTGVDERLDTGQSVAQLEVQIQGGRKMLFKANFLSSQRTYVRVTVEVVENQQLTSNTTVKEQKLTTKRPVSPSPQWHEMLLFQGLPAAVGTLQIDLMQEEKIGADELVGTFILPLGRLQDQRQMEKWIGLEKQKEKMTGSELFITCRFQRSPISALELELELLQNQINELHLFLGRHQNLVGLSMQDSFVTTSSMTSCVNPLQGKEVVTGKMLEQSVVSTRFSAVASFPPAMRKRELGDDVDVGLEATRVKRQRVNSERQVNSLSDRIANWLLPTSALGTPTSAGKEMGTELQHGVFSTEESGGVTTNQFFPFKQSRPAPAPRRPRRTGRSLFAAPPKTPRALQAIEKWLFTDKDGNPRDLPFGRQAPSY
ncbi:unnamed protein product [Peronospora belbahrii]|uniref:C2 domain-containing protein n=1 Tax=Peronospora belbahrii TaxID=622444 RepID=A0AAU9KRH1_9STRA|nr:unnamed protein product [Peronospora belbahrii]CAH0519039.1 unnamed protein product [Peronospora belbahrii]